MSFSKRQITESQATLLRDLSTFHMVSLLLSSGERGGEGRGGGKASRV